MEPEHYIMLPFVKTLILDDLCELSRESPQYINAAFYALPLSGAVPFPFLREKIKPQTVPKILGQHPSLFHGLSVHTERGAGGAWVCKVWGVIVKELEQQLEQLLHGKKLQRLRTQKSTYLHLREFPELGRLTGAEWAFFLTLFHQAFR